MKQSEINGLYNEMEQLKKQRKKDMDTINKKEEQIIQHILEHGNVLAYKEDVPHILTVVNGSTRKFDKARLADETGRTQAQLNPPGIAEIVEDGQASSKELEDYYYEEPEQKLKARKAKKSDMELLHSSGRI